MAILSALGYLCFEKDFTGLLCIVKSINYDDLRIVGIEELFGIYLQAGQQKSR